MIFKLSISVLLFINNMAVDAINVDAEICPSVEKPKIKGSLSFLQWEKDSKISMLGFTKRYKLEIGQDLILECAAIGFPTPKVYWYRLGDEKQEVYTLPEHGGFLTSNAIKHINLTASVRTKRFIFGATHEDNDSYICVADNGVSTISRYVDVRVENIAMNQTNRTYEIRKPYIKTWTEYSIARIGYAVILKCQAETDDGTALYWEDADGIRLDMFKRYTQLPSGDLLIKSVRFSDIGEYRCVSQNHYGSDVKKMFLYTMY